MTPKDLMLNIAVNMGRVSRWAMEGKGIRIKQFLAETEGYLRELERSDYNQRVSPTLINFKKKLKELKSNIKLNEIWAEDALTWANILTHRAKLANQK